MRERDSGGAEEEESLSATKQYNSKSWRRKEGCVGQAGAQVFFHFLSFFFVVVMKDWWHSILGKPKPPVQKSSSLFELFHLGFGGWLLKWAVRNVATASGQGNWKWRCSWYAYVAWSRYLAPGGCLARGRRFVLIGIWKGWINLPLRPLR